MIGHSVTATLWQVDMRYTAADGKHVETRHLVLTADPSGSGLYEIACRKVKSELVAQKVALASGFVMSTVHRIGEASGTAMPVMGTEN